jgi:ABC-type branched-subunit amino acid transport system ATPase component
MDDNRTPTADCRPKLLMPDAPTEGLQPSMVDKIVGILRPLCERAGRTSVLVEHNPGFVAEPSQRVLVIQRGCISKQLAPDQIATSEAIRELVENPMTIH